VRQALLGERVDGRWDCNHALHRPWKRCECRRCATTHAGLVGGLSVLLAVVVISLVALWLTFHFRRNARDLELAKVSQRCGDGTGDTG